MADSYREEKIRTSTLADPVSRGGTEARRCACELVGHQIAHALLDHQVLEPGTRVGWVDHLASIPETSGFGRLGAVSAIPERSIVWNAVLGRVFWKSGS